MHKISYEYYDYVRAIIDHQVTEEDYENSDLPYDENITWFEIVKTLTAATIAKRSKNRPTEKSIIKKLDRQGLANFLRYMKNALEGGGSYGHADIYNHINMSRYRNENKNSLLGGRSIIIIDQKDFMFSSHAGARLYYQKRDGFLSDQKPNISEKQKEEIADICVDELNWAAQNQEMFCDAVELQRVANKENILGQIRIKHKDHPWTPEEVELVLEVNGMQISSVFSPLRESSGYAAPFILAVKHKKIMNVVNNEAKIWIDQNETPKGLVFQVKYGLKMVTRQEDRNGEQVFGAAQGSPVTRLEVHVMSELQQCNQKLVKERMEIHAGFERLKTDASPQETISELSKRDKYIKKSVLENMANDLRIQSGHYKKRSKKKQEITQGTIRIDRVAQHVLSLVEKHEPSDFQRIMRDGYGKTTLPYSVLEGFIKQKKYKTKKGQIKNKKNEPFSFKTKEGEMQVVFDLAPQMKWDGNKLHIPEQPETILSHFEGRPAKEVVEHPIAEMLGTVKKARKNRFITFVEFHPIQDEVSFEGAG